MRMRKEGNLYQLTFMPRFFPINCYFVEEEEGLTLIDAALPNSVAAIMKAAAEIGKEVRKIILTHAHNDHVGALDGLKDKWDVPVYVSSREARLLAGDRSLAPTEPQTPIRGGIPKKIKTKPDFLLKEGDRIGSLLAIAAPGHTPGSIALLDERSNAVIAGDAFQTRGGIAVSGVTIPSFPFPAMATWNLEAAVQSARKINGLMPSLLAVGHGDLLSSPSGKINEAIKKAEERLMK
ncbi:MBL fold metallo-hydrolase [Bacillus sp. REN3]|uniref:MBL fold metallo-hydrolase n=1 Tax=Bacillus sp. REN3 TaxID=2802440 RepID=UPI001AEDC0ED|nr:MBL fold metallo-hydrolase [Bacillus sp. REN3]